MQAAFWSKGEAESHVRLAIHNVGYCTLQDRFERQKNKKKKKNLSLLALKLS